MGQRVGRRVGRFVGGLVVGKGVVGEDVGTGDRVGGEVVVEDLEKKATSPCARDTARNNSSNRPKHVHRTQDELSSVRNQHGVSGPKERQQQQKLRRRSTVRVVRVPKDAGVSPLNSDVSSMLVRSVTTVFLNPGGRR